MSSTDEPSEKEVEHALSLIHESGYEPLRAAVVDIGTTCDFDAGDGPCPQAVTQVVVMMDTVGCGAVAVCDHHAKAHYLAIKRWRVLHNLPILETRETIQA